MKRPIFFAVLALLLLGLFLWGPIGRSDKQPGGQGAQQRGRSGGTVEEETELDKETLARSIGVFHAMQDYPDLEGLPGRETVIQIRDRLNHWIRRRPADGKWKAEPVLLEWTTRSRSLAVKARQAADLMQTLQGTGPTADERKEMSPEERTRLVAEDRKTFSTTLERLEAELTAQGREYEIFPMVRIAEQIGALRTKLKTLDAQLNAPEGVVRAVMQQMVVERQMLVDVAGALESFADTFTQDVLELRGYDIDYLKQSAWMRSIGTWARGSKQGNLDRAKALHDWTARNIDLRDEFLRVDEQRAVQAPLQMPWQTLLLGSGTVWDRAWVFLELLRQQRIDACLLAFPVRTNTAGENPVSAPPTPEPSGMEPSGMEPSPTVAESPRLSFLGIGVLIDGEIYIFLLQEGLPLPGKSGPQLDERGRLDVPEVATLSALIADPTLLDRATTGNVRPNLTAETLKQTRALLPLNPASSSKRMRIIEKELSRNQTMVLSSPVGEQRERFAAARGIAAVDFWKYPFAALFETLAEPRGVDEQLLPYRMIGVKSRDYALWKGRMYYFQGRFAGTVGAAECLMKAMTPDRLIHEMRSELRGQEGMAAEMAYRLVNTWAGYWLGLAAAQEEKWDSAHDFLMEKSGFGLQTPWRRGVPYNLGRVNEAEKNYPEAIRLFEQSGNPLRARWLGELTE